MNSFFPSRAGFPRTVPTRTLRGFTLIELVTVVVLLGILAFAVLPRFVPDGFIQGSFREELKQSLRYAQKSALNSGCPVTFTIDSNTYSAVWAPGACGPGAPAAAVTVPGLRGEKLHGTAPNHTAVSDASFTFDLSGRANTPGNVTVGAYIITVHSTGYVQ